MPEKASVKSWPPQRIILLSGDIKAISATMLEAALARIPKKGSRRPLFLIINSEGGDFYAMLKMRSLLQPHARSLVTVVHGKAYSGALTLFEMGTRRIMTEQSALRFHQANHNFLKNETLNAAAMTSLVAQLHEIDALQKLIYLERTAPAPTPLVKRLEALFAREAYLRYPQAKDINLVDDVIPEPRSMQALIDHLMTNEADDVFIESLRELSKWY